MSEIDGPNVAPLAEASVAPVVTFKKRGGAKRKEFRAPAASLAARTDAQLLAAAPIAAEPATNDAATTNAHATNASTSDVTTTSASEPAVTITDETNGDVPSTTARDDDDEDVDVGPSASTAAALAQAADVDTSDPEESDTEDAPTIGGGGVARPTKRARKENPLVQSTRQKLSKEHDLTIRSDRSAAPDLRSASAQVTQTVERPDYKRDPSKPKWSGPQKPQASNVRMISRMDYEPNVCKDYKETGRCGYGDSCVFLHDRGVYKQSWQLDADWNAAQEAKRKRALLGITEEEEEAAKAAASSEEGQMPWACEICRQPFRTPVVTKCNHYFCESCALNAYAKDTRCAVCRQQTAGIFNTATKLIAVLKQRQAVGFDPRSEIEKREAARKAEKEQKLAIAKATGSEWSLPGRTAGL